MGSLPGLPDFLLFLDFLESNVPDMMGLDCCLLDCLPVIIFLPASVRDLARLALGLGLLGLLGLVVPSIIRPGLDVCCGVCGSSDIGFDHPVVAK